MPRETQLMALPNVVDVAVGVLVNAEGEVLLAKRHASQFKGNLWEFPGGKFEPGETAEQALAREIFEELGVVVKHSERLGVFPYQYSEMNVCLHVFRVTAYEGEVQAKLQQALRWVRADTLNQFDFPEANLQFLSQLVPA